jgi:hypothetical protein
VNVSEKQDEKQKLKNQLEEPHFISKVDRIIEKINTKINQDIFIRDILIYPEQVSNGFPDTAMGEAEVPLIYKDKPFAERLRTHIKQLAKIANTYHEAYCCDKDNAGVYHIKSDCLNNITRLLTHEFSMYGKQPLTLEEYSSLISFLEGISQEQHENVHLLLSSISVLSEKDELLNICLYVQFGKEIKINVMTKSLISRIDFVYPGVSNFTHQGRESGVIFTAYKNSSVSPVSSESIFTVCTKGGARYNQIVEICSEHDMRRGITTLNNSFASTVRPKQYDHIITSNSVLPLKCKITTPSAIQIDPIFSRIDNIEDKIFLLTRESPQACINPDEIFHPNVSVISSDVIKTEDLDFYYLSDYPSTKVEKIENPYRFIVHSPPVGSNYFISPQEPRKLEELYPDLQEVLEGRDLYYAASKGHEEIFSFLIKNSKYHSEYLHKKDQIGNYPLHTACRLGDNKAVEIFLNHNANINELNDKRCTPLHIAVEHKHTKVIETLVSHQKQKADITIINLANNTPLEIACIKNDSEIIHLLLKHYPMTKESSYDDYLANTLYLSPDNIEKIKSITQSTAYCKMANGNSISSNLQTFSLFKSSSLQEKRDTTNELHLEIIRKNPNP